MKKFIFIFLLVLVNVLSYGLANSTEIYIGEIITLYDGPGNSGGGEFIVARYSDGAYLGSSFCIEMNEGGAMGSEMIVADISTQAVNGGIGGGNPDPLDARTSYLFYHFVKGDLLGYDYGSGREASANSLQQAIWMIEEELGLPGSGPGAGLGINPFFDLATAAIAGGSTDGLGEVRVLNLEDRYGNKLQDQLFLVPEPTSILILGASLLGISFFIRRKSKKA